MKRFTTLRNLTLGLSLALVSVGVSAAELPQHQDAMHLGVGGCAASLCHGSLRGKDAYSVLQNEYTVWMTHDRHSKAWQTLQNDQSRRIARNLGLENAHEAKICLDCHSDNVPEDRRGALFQITDGVGCEACHGGADPWLSAHLRGSGKHSDNVESGMYPTTDIDSRMDLCLSCHMGTKDKFATHKIMGAGHPRLGFEVETFTAIQPAHYRIDKDYHERKTLTPATTAWAIGQIKSAQHYLDLLQSDLFDMKGMIPELSFFDCQACHHPLDDHRYSPRKTLGVTGPGVFHLADSHLLYAAMIAGSVDRGMQSEIESQIASLHEATQDGVKAVKRAAGKLEKSINKLAERFDGNNVSQATSQQWLREILAQGKDGQLNDFATAEQAAMAIPVLLGKRANSGALKAQIDQLFLLLESDVSFNPQRYRQQLALIGQTAGK